MTALAILFSTVLGAILAAVGIWLWRSQPWRGDRPRYPVVLAHGLFGFDAIGIGSFKHDYFRGVVESLRGLGIEVFVPAVPPAASIETRAQALAEQIRALPAARVNIIAHSMGGLDARYAIKHLGIASRVAALVTIGTPHHGTPVADVAATVFHERLGLKRLLLGVGLEALYDLTTDHLRAFNRLVPNVRKVRYASVVCAADAAHTPVHPLLRLTFAFLQEKVGPNDGVVPAQSQSWGKVIATVACDHWAQIGWSEGIDTAQLYRRITRQLRAWGA